MAAIQKVIRCKAGEAKVLVKSPTEHIQACWMRGNFYEPRMLEYIYDCQYSGVYIDIGSSIGNHTLFFAKFCRSDYVISVEPVKESIMHQEENLILNDVKKRVGILDTALGKSTGRGKMERFGVQENVGLYHLVEGDEVWIERLDELVKPWHIALVKIDVEGNVLDILEGAKRILETCKPALFIELNGEKDEVVSFLNGFGYQLGDRFNFTPTYEFV